MSRTTGLGPAALVAVALAAAVMAPSGAAASTYDDSSGDSAYTRGTVVAPDLQPPAAFAPIGIVDDPVDGAAVPDVAQARILAGSPGKAPSSDPVTAHGTEVASVAAARQDGIGVVGIAPGAPLLSWGYKEDGQDPSCDEVTDGIVRLADAGAKVINLSLETPDDCPELQLAIGAAYGDGALVVASAGNDGRQNPPPPATYPAQYPHVLTVGALSLGLTAADFSTPGSGVDLVAPGEAVPVALPPALDTDGTADGVTTATGTSFAAPIVSGLASWLIGARRGIKPSQVADLLRATARDQGDPGWDAKTGFGLPDLASALNARLPQADGYEPNDLITEVDGTGYEGADPYRSGTLRATIQPVEDPADVYRIRVRAHGRATARLTGGAGTKVYAYASRARTFTAKPLSTGRTVTVRNATRRSATYYLAVRVPATATPVATSIPYTLKIRR